MPDVVCPMPTAHSYDDVKAAYDKARKTMPQLTPAAWRKAAAQDLGMDYATFLKVWKAKPSKKVVSESTPTLPASAAPGPDMGLAAPVVKATEGSIKLPTTASVKKIITEAGIKKEGYTKEKYTHTGQMYGGGQTYIPGIKKVTAESVEYVGDYVEVQLSAAMEAYKIEALAAKLTKEGWYVRYSTGQMNVKILRISKNPISTDAKMSWSPDFGKPTTPIAPAKKAAAPPKTSSTPKPAPEPEPSMPEVGKYLYNADYPDGVLVSKYGLLDNNLARQVFKTMKHDMPGATPATLRKAAAEYLDVPYKDYLKAWKTKKTSSSYSTAAPSSPNLPTPSQIPLKPGQKYTATSPPTYDSLKDDLASLYGPGANKSYIQPSVPGPGQWVVDVPKSLYPDVNDVIKIAAGLEKQGYTVVRSGHTLKITHEGAKKAAAKAAEAAKKAEAEAIKTGYKVRTDGTIEINKPTAQTIHNDWVKKITTEERQAVQSYTGSSYQSWNAGLRKGAGTTSARTKALDAALQKGEAPFDMHVWRGAQTPADILATFKPGAKFVDEAYGSTAIDEGHAWVRNTLFVIKMPKGTRGAYVDPISNHRGEQEWIMPRGTEYRIVSVRKEGSRTIVEMVVVRQPVR